MCKSTTTHHKKGQKRNVSDAKKKRGRDTEQKLEKQRPEKAQPGKRTTPKERKNENPMQKTESKRNQECHLNEGARSHRATNRPRRRHATWHVAKKTLEEGAGPVNLKAPDPATAVSMVG